MDVLNFFMEIKKANGCVKTENSLKKKDKFFRNHSIEMKNKFQSGLGRWDGHSIPSQESIAFLEGRKATVELKTVHPHFSRQQ